MSRVTLISAASLVQFMILGCSKPPAVASPEPTPTEAFAARVDELRREKQIPGLAVVVLRDRAMLLSCGFGYADIERQVLVTPDTPFDIASVTKPLSAVVALRLAELGKLDLSAPMDTYDGFREFSSAARENGGIFFNDYATGPTRLTLRHVLMMEANGDPGSRFMYNPPSYSWASRPMSQASGKAFSILTEEHVFRPAGMTRSARTHRKLPLPENLARDLARPYHIDASGKVVRSDPPLPQGDGAAGGVITTAADLARFDVALDEGKLLTRTSREMMWSSGRAKSGASLPYGLGWFVNDVRGQTLVWHTGLWEQKYSALYMKVPAQSLTLILLANSDGLNWESRLDEAVVERSPFAAAFLDIFLR
ncbi:MAG: serine hydrolase domain-containing protein [Gemmataceae bacterium]